MTGSVQFANPTGPGWGRPADGDFNDPRMRGRDDRPYGPLPRGWAQFRGLHHYGDRAMVHYSVGDADVLELPGIEPLDVDGEATGASKIAFTRSIQLGPRTEDLWLQVARTASGRVVRKWDKTDPVWRRGVLAVTSGAPASAPASSGRVGDGAHYAETDGQGLDLHRDFTLCARFKTRKGGTILAQTAAGPKWVPGGRALFVRGQAPGVRHRLGGRRDVAAGSGRQPLARCGADLASGPTGRRSCLSTAGSTGAVDCRPSTEPIGNTLCGLDSRRRNFPSPSIFRGSLQSVAVFQRQLSAAEVSAPERPERRRTAQKGGRLVDAREVGGGTGAGSLPALQRLPPEIDSGSPFGRPQRVGPGRCRASRYRLARPHHGRCAVASPCRPRRAAGHPHRCGGPFPGTADCSTLAVA